MVGSLLLCSLRNNSTVRMVGKIKKKENCSNFRDFFDLLFSSKICKKMEMTMNAAGCSLKSSLPPVRANPRRVSVFFSFSSLHSQERGQDRHFSENTEIADF